MEPLARGPADAAIEEMRHRRTALLQAWQARIPARDRAGKACPAGVACPASCAPRAGAGARTLAEAFASLRAVRLRRGRGLGRGLRACLVGLGRTLRISACKKRQHAREQHSFHGCPVGVMRDCDGSLEERVSGRSVAQAPYFGGKFQSLFSNGSFLSECADCALLWKKVRFLSFTLHRGDNIYGAYLPFCLNRQKPRDFHSLADSPPSQTTAYPGITRKSQIHDIIP